MEERFVYFISCGDCGYVGRTKDIRHRMSQHGQPPIWAILETVEGEKRGAEQEAHWKRHFESLGVKLLNKREVVCGFTTRPRPLKQLAYLREQVELALKRKTERCIIWPFSLRGSGYGQVPIGNGKADSAHVVAWKVAHPGEEIPVGFEIMHSKECGSERRCFNPNHLKPGTRKSNMRTAMELGHINGPGDKTAGEKNGRAKLTTEQIAEIRRRYAAGESQRKLGGEYGVVHATIHYIVAGKHWTEAA
jgi:hypothetical protein